MSHPAELQLVIQQCPQLKSVHTSKKRPLGPLSLLCTYQEQGCHILQLAGFQFRAIIMKVSG